MAAGMALCLLIGVGLPYGEFIIQGTRLGLSSSTPAAFFLLFLLVVLVQPLLGVARRSWMFNRAELLLVAVMMMLATAVPTRGFTGVALAVISAATYYAGPENGWAENLIPHIPDWIAPDDEAAIKAFYEGLPQGAKVPREVWLGPLGWWLLFMAGLYCVMICSMAIMRRQWMDHERLLYPLVQVPLTMIEDGGANRRLQPFLKNPLLWAGFAVPLIINTINALSHYYPFIPELAFNFSFSLVPDTPEIRVRPNYLMIGLAYFINTGVSIQVSPGYYVEVVPRSSIVKSDFIMANSVGVIDPDYRGLIFLPLRYVGTKSGVTACERMLGQRVAQMLIRRLEPCQIEEVQELDVTERGEKGFGSTG